MSHYNGVTFRFAGTLGMTAAELAEFVEFAKKTLPGAVIETNMVTTAMRISLVEVSYPERRDGPTMQDVDTITGLPKGPSINLRGQALHKAGQEVIFRYYQQPIDSTTA